MGISKGSSLWEEKRIVLQSTMNCTCRSISGRLLPMNGYLQPGKSRAGSGRRTRQVAGFGRVFGIKVYGYGDLQRPENMGFSFIYKRLYMIVQVILEQRGIARQREKV